MSEVKSSRMSKKEKKENKKEIIGGILFTLVYGIFLMWISGMAQVYFPGLVSPGGGQYFDVSLGIIVIGTALYFVLVSCLKTKYARRG